MTVIDGNNNQQALSFHYSILLKLLHSLNTLPNLLKLEEVMCLPNPVIGVHQYIGLRWINRFLGRK